jgi:hypothetical protein
MIKGRGRERRGRKVRGGMGWGEPPRIQILATTLIEANKKLEADDIQTVRLSYF